MTFLPSIHLHLKREMRRRFSLLVRLTSSTMLRFQFHANVGVDGIVLVTSQIAKDPSRVPAVAWGKCDAYKGINMGY